MTRQLDSEKRERFLSAALKLFVSKGVANTSTAEIARQAGTAAGTLFLYFPTKQHLLDELILKIGRDQAACINARLDPALSARGTFFTIWHGTLQWFLENIEAYAYLQQVRDTGLISQAAVLESGRYFDYYYNAIQKGNRENSIKKYSLGLIGDFLYQDMVAVMNQIMVLPDPDKRQEIIAQGFDIFWDGIKSTSGGSPDGE